MIPTVIRLFEELERRGISYCHWKSNWVLDKTLAGATDIDILIRRTHATRFRSLLDELGFRPAIEANVHPFPSVEHHHALDPDTSVIVHVHAYYRIISGDSLAKNYHLPFEDMLLSDVRHLHGVAVPSVPAEITSFVVRMLLKHTSLLELAFVTRDWKLVKAEVDWLVTDEAAAKAIAEVERWIPGFEPALLRAGLDAIRTDASLLTRVRLGRRAQRQLRSYRRHGRLAARWTAASGFAERAVHKARGRTKGLTPGGGGAVIAFVGSEATGKSTMLAATEDWLAEQFTVRRIHVGKPPSTVLTAAPNLVLPLLRRLAPGQRTTSMTVSVPEHSGVVDPSERASGQLPLLFAIRSVMLAHDRRALLRRAAADAANGQIVLCDRYPSDIVGAPDGPQLGRFQTSGRVVRSWLVHHEAATYADVPPADLVLQLWAPLEVAMQRNRTRGKFEPEEFVRVRHAISSSLSFGRSTVCCIDTDRSEAETFDTIRHAIWENL